MKKVIIILTTLLPFLFSFTNAELNQLNCPPPANVRVDSQTTTTVTYNWDDCNCFNTGYHVYYEKNGVASQEWVTTASDFTFDNLSSGEYHFYFYTECVSGSESIIVEDGIVF